MTNVKTEPSHPNSPVSVNATPPPPHGKHPQQVQQQLKGAHNIERASNNIAPTATTPSTTPTPPTTNNNNNRPSFSYPSPQQQISNPISPASVGEGVGSGGSSLFRYQNSGKQQPVQNHSPVESTCNSAISSREGTPGPTKLWGAASGSVTAAGSTSSGVSDEMACPVTGAPNVDISRVQVKEEIVPKMSSYESNEYSRRPSVNLSYPAAVVARSTAADSYSYSPTYHSLPQQVSMPPRPVNSSLSSASAGAAGSQQDRSGPGGSLLSGGVSVGVGGGGGGYRPSVGRPPIMIPGNSEGGVAHSNVKIGRRPAHLPKVLKFEDHTLPHGWQRKLKQRKHGKQAGRWDVYIYSPCGVKFASRKKLKHFFEKNNLQYDAEQFDFTPYGKHIENNSAAGSAAGSGGGGPQRHLSSASSDGNRHSGSPGSAVHSPSAGSSGGGPFSGCGSGGMPLEFMPPGLQPPAAHGHHTYMPPLPSYEFNPMMESPPNANAREIPHNHILNLSQNQQLNPLSRVGATSGGSSGGVGLGTSLPAPTALRTSVTGSSSGGGAVTNFPTEIDDILNENSDTQFRHRLREYHHDLRADLSSAAVAAAHHHHTTRHHNIAHLPSPDDDHPHHPHVNHHHHPHLHRPGGGGGGGSGSGPEDEGRRTGEDSTERAAAGFMATSINILSDGNMDMGMDMYTNIYAAP